jgi:hypothetical protein
MKAFLAASLLCFLVYVGFCLYWLFTHKDKDDDENGDVT